MSDDMAQPEPPDGEESYIVSAMALTDAGIVDDDLVVIKLALTNDLPMIVNLSAGALSQILSRLTQVYNALLVQRHQTKGHVEVYASNPKQVLVQETPAGDAVLVSFSNAFGGLESFRLSPEKTLQLSVDTRDAATKAGQLASKSRN